jgi:hypothetical protein
VIAEEVLAAAGAVLAVIGAADATKI